MKIKSVEAIPFSYQEPIDHNRYRSACLVKITAEDGQVGWGECCTYFPEATRAAAALVEGMANIVVGQNALHTETVWRKLHDHSWWYGNGAGIASIAISGIDIALWDLKGRILDTSVLNLLGGPAHDKLPAVASYHATHESIEVMVEEILAMTETGLQGCKVGFGKLGNANLGFDHDHDVEYVRQVTEAIGSNNKLMIDLGAKNFWDIPTAIARAKAFEEYGVHWLEEPLGHDDPEGYAALRANSGIRIAYGEREWNPRGVQRIVDTGTVDVIGLDPGRVEGITGFMKSAAICSQNRRQANAHNFSTAIVGKASQALAWANPSCYLLELMPVYGPAQKDLADNPVWHENGNVPMPTGPGLGMEINEDMVESSRLDR